MQKRSPFGRPFMLIKKDLIREAEGKCQGCGKRFPSSLSVARMAMRDDYCAVDFKVPIHRGGKVELRNAQVLCMPCFKGKNRDSLTDAEWRARGRPQRQGIPKLIKGF